MNFKIWFERQDTGYWATHSDDPDLNGITRHVKYIKPKLRKNKKIDKMFGKRRKKSR